MPAPVSTKPDLVSALFRGGIHLPERFRQTTGTLDVKDVQTTRPTSGAVYPVGSNTR